MSVATTGVLWTEANQQFLASVVAALKSRLETHLAGTPVTDLPLDGLPDVFEPPPALASLTDTFELSEFEIHLLGMCAAVELDAQFADLCARAHGDPRRRWMTLGLGLAVLPDGHWSALSPAGTLRRWRFLVLDSGDSLTTSQLRIDERVLHHLAGVSYVDDRLDGLVDQAPPAGVLPASHDAVAERAAALWLQSTQSSAPVIQLCGPDLSALAAVAAAACERLGLGLLRLHAEDLPGEPGDRTALARLCERELALTRCALLLTFGGDSADETPTGSAARFASEMSGPLFVAAHEPASLPSRHPIRLDVEPPGFSERRLLWNRAMGPAAAGVGPELDAVVAQFDLDTLAIAAVADSLGPQPSPEGPARLWDACRVQARQRLANLAERIRSRVGWEDLVLPGPQTRQLHQVALHVRNRRTVYEEWGFAGRSDRGLGISALFAGPSGTGKTLAAEVLANDLQLDLFRIDLSQVVSKYIGETEKNLARIFSAAEQSGAVLLFDEADALFGKRSEVKDSHDRYANIEVGYLLQRMEAYRGLAILTTNMKSALDQAFLRRIRFVVQFPFPDTAQREQIWRRIFPAQTPVDGLDPSRLARLSVAGGNIRNIALNAAFLAAGEGSAVAMRHVAAAARDEYAKLEKTLTATELGGAA